MASPNAQPDQQYTAVPAPCSGQVAMYFACWCSGTGNKRRVSEPEGRELGEGFKKWRRTGLFAPVPAGVCIRNWVAATGIHPCVLLPPGIPATLSAQQWHMLHSFLRAWVSICATALLLPATWWVLLVVYKLFPSM